MNDENVSLKEILLQVSHKLDRFLEAHAVLHGQMAQREARVEVIMEQRETWGQRLDALETWEAEVKGQMKLLKWVSGGGAIALAGMILKLLGVPVPI